MTTRSKQRRGAVPPASSRKATWLFIAVTIILAGPILALPYFVHLIRPVPYQAGPEQRRSAQSCGDARPGAVSRGGSAWTGLYVLAATAGLASIAYSFIPSGAS